MVPIFSLSFFTLQLHFPESGYTEAAIGYFFKALTPTSALTSPAPASPPAPLALSSPQRYQRNLGLNPVPSALKISPRAGEGREGRVVGGDQLHKGAGELCWSGLGRGCTWCVCPTMDACGSAHGSNPAPSATQSLPRTGGSPGCELGVAPCSLLLKANHLEESFGAKAAFKGNIGSLVWLQQRLLC